MAFAARFISQMIAALQPSHNVLLDGFGLVVDVDFFVAEAVG